MQPDEASLRATAAYLAQAPGAYPARLILLTGGACVTNLADARDRMTTGEDAGAITAVALVLRPRAMPAHLQILWTTRAHLLGAVRAA